METRFGIRVLKGDDASVPVSGYSFETAADGEILLGALERLEETLGLYPEGFFSALTGGDPNRLVIELTGRISSCGEGLVESPAAVAFSSDGTDVIAVDVSRGLEPSVIVHELCHAVDRRLSGLAESDPSYWNDADWAALNHEGFTYHYAYCNAAGVPYSECGDMAFTAEEDGEIWFVNRYSTTYPTEDRAVMTEYLFSQGGRMSCMSSPHIAEKLGYYFAAVRYYLDPGGKWGETFWERKLKAVTGSRLVYHIIPLYSYSSASTAALSACSSGFALSTTRTVPLS
jgi:Mlc titration factor MtfA (ptsG expression regulator)